MIPTEFKTQYIASLPSVPDELRDELDLERFVPFASDRVASLSIAPEDAAILSDVGLPNAASPGLTFELDLKRRLAPIDGFPQMLAIGTNAYGDYVCLDMHSDGAIIYINHDNLNARVFINSSVSTLARSICLYSSHRHAHDPADLLAAIRPFDPDACVDGSFWHHESGALANDGG